MSDGDPFVGTIDLVSGDGQQQILLKYNQTPGAELSLDKTFIHCFKKLGLTSEEKQILSVKDRSIIYHYQQIGENRLLKLAEKLTEVISKKCLGSDLHIRAEHLGAFVCLAAIYSGKLPVNKHISFSLGNAPFAIFPAKLANKDLPARGRYSVSFFVDESCWVKNFFSLSQSPRGLEDKSLCKKTA